MKGLKRYSLEYKSTLKYLEETLNETNVLSAGLLKQLNFSSGNFCVYLPSNSNLEGLYDFQSGGILPQNPILEYEDKNTKSRYQIIPTIRDELTEHLMLVLKKNKNLSCVFDDVTLILNDYSNSKLFDKFGRFYREEVYFFVNYPCTEKDIQDCLRVSNAVWHSLCVVTEATFQNKELSYEEINQICKRMKTFFVGAYDGEGYIFWERN